MSAQDTHVPAGPFLTWLEALVEQLGRNATRDTLLVGGEVLDALLAMEATDEISLARVDRFLMRADGAESLATLYPSDDRPDGRRADLGRSYVCDEQTLIRAHAMHMDGMSARAVARELFDRCYSASPKALANAFLKAWSGRGWEVRSRSEATALSNAQRAWRPPCQHVLTQGERRGQRCTRQSVGDDGWCWHHHPEQRAAGIARLRAGVAA